MRTQNLAICAVLFALLVGCNRGEPLTDSLVTRAQRTWAGHAPAHYKLQMSIEGDKIEDGEFEIEVRNGQVVTATRNGKAFAAKDKFYTITGMFDFFKDELIMGQDAVEYFQATPDAEVHQKLLIDEETGQPKRYFRAVTGTAHSITIKAKPVEVLP